MTQTIRILGLLLLVTLASVTAPLGVGTAAASTIPPETSDTPSTADEGPIVVTYDVAIHPENTSRLHVSATVDIPASVSKFRFTTRPTGFELHDTDGFTRQPNEGIVWDGKPTPATVTYSVPRNQTGNFDKLGMAGQGDWSFVHLNKIDMQFRYSYYGDNPGWHERLTPDGEGYGSVTLAVIGNYTTYGDEADGFRLIVPEAAEMREDPTDVLTALQTSRDMLAVGETDRVVTVFVAPDPVRGGGLAPWTEHDGVQDVWVHEGSALNVSSSTWLHEYIHTRQTHEWATDMQWFVEGSADYYAALLAVQQNRATFDSFHRRVTPTVQNPAVLADKTTWDGAPYEQGRRTLAALDAEIHRATDGERSLLDVFARMNAHDGNVTHAAFTQMVVDTSGDDSLADWLDRYTMSREMPAPPEDPALYARTGAAADSDGDGLADAHETALGTDPFDQHSDADALADGTELDRGTNPLTPDSDVDAFPDGVEVTRGTDPLTHTSVVQLTFLFCGVE